MSFDDLFIDAHGVLVPERGLADEKLVDEDPQGPPVDGKPVAAVVDDLRREVLWRSAERVCFVVPDLFGKAEVDQPDVSFCVQQDVLGLQIAVDDALHIMQILDGEGYLGGIESGGVFVEASRTSQVAKDLPAGAVVQLRQ